VCCNGRFAIELLEDRGNLRSFSGYLQISPLARFANRLLKTNDIYEFELSFVFKSPRWQSVLLACLAPCLVTGCASTFETRAVESLHASSPVLTLEREAPFRSIPRVRLSSLARRVIPRVHVNLNR
jgi:hypothetical protein